MRQIKANLKEMGITSSTGTDFSMSTLRRLLGNERYMLNTHKKNIIIDIRGYILYQAK